MLFVMLISYAMKKMKMFDDFTLATHYSPSMDAYFHFDNAVFIWADNEWIEYTAIGYIEDLRELDS